MMMTMMMMMIHVPSCNLCSFHYRRHDQPCCYWNHPCSGPVFWNRVLIVANEIRSLCCFVAVVLVLLVAAHAAAEVAIFAFAHCVAPRSASSIQSVTNRSCDDRHCDHCEYCDDSFCCHWHCSVAAAASSTMTNRCLIRTRFHRLSCWYCWPPSASELERQRPRRTWPSSFAAGVPTAQQDTSPSCAQSTCPFSARNVADQAPGTGAIWDASGSSRTRRARRYRSAQRRAFCPNRHPCTRLGRTATSVPDSGLDYTSAGTGWWSARCPTSRHAETGAAAATAIAVPVRCGNPSPTGTGIASARHRWILRTCATSVSAMRATAPTRALAPFWVMSCLVMFVLLLVMFVFVSSALADGPTNDADSRS
mmetsp:Transcript_2854/g.7996  ORF Transcript_2854/g.7996 Transcript_2854/m.7996 type:complete len:365 (+) Transcript_2854:3-1097(+)